MKDLNFVGILHSLFEQGNRGTHSKLFWDLILLIWVPFDLNNGALT